MEEQGGSVAEDQFFKSKSYASVYASRIAEGH
jgi:hypothetical protein